jgi:hypothetical protein
MLFVYGNPRLDELIEMTKDRVFFDEPENAKLVTDYIARATNELLSSDEHEQTSYFDDFVLESIESIIDDVLKRLAMPFANVRLFGESPNPYDYFLILEIEDGCIRACQYPRHRELLTLRAYSEYHPNELQRVQNSWGRRR